MEIKDAIKLASELMEEHGLFLKGWDLKITNTRKRKGETAWRGKVPAHIGISRHAIAERSDEDIRQIILHEIAHALLPIEENHGPVWKAKAAEIGYVLGTTMKPTEAEALAHKEQLEKRVNSRARAAARYRLRKTGQVETPPLRVGAIIYCEGQEWYIFDMKRVWCHATKVIEKSPTKYTEFRISTVRDLVIS